MNNTNLTIYKINDYIYVINLNGEFVNTEKIINSLRISLYVFIKILEKYKAHKFSKFNDNYYFKNKEDTQNFLDNLESELIMEILVGD